MAAYRVAHAVPGRLRVRYPRRWLRQAALEAAVLRIPGVRGVTVTALTGSLVIEYDRHRVGAPALLDALSRVSPAAASGSSNGVRRRRGREPEERRSGALLRLLVASGVFTATCLPLPGPVGAALVLGSGAPLAGRALRTLAGRGRLNVDVLDAVTLLVLALRGNYRAAGLVIWLLSAGQYVLHCSVVTVRRSVAGSLGLQVAAVTVPWLRRLLGTAPLTWVDWGIAGAGAVLPLGSRLAIASMQARSRRTARIARP